MTSRRPYYFYWLYVGLEACVGRNVFKAMASLLGVRRQLSRELVCDRGARCLLGHVLFDGGIFQTNMQFRTPSRCNGHGHGWSLHRHLKKNKFYDAKNYINKDWSCSSYSKEYKVNL